MNGSPRAVTCQHCGGHKVSERISRITRRRSRLILLIVVLIVTMVLSFKFHRCYSRGQHSLKIDQPYDRWMPLVFIGGVPRSGSSLLRTLLDAHPEVRCGPDTIVIPLVLKIYHHWLNHFPEYMKLEEAGVSSQVLQSAVASLCLEIIVHHGDSAPRYCTKDPVVLQYASYVSDLFPNAKFLFVVRDGRATVHSIISRQIVETRFDLESYRKSMEQWDKAINIILDQCLLVGPSRCRIIHYEQLVLRPRHVLSGVLKFLNIPWDESVLHHETLIGKPEGIRFSRFDRSSSEVRRAIYQDSLTRWFDRFPEDVLIDSAQLSPMLHKFGYSSFNSTPDYRILEGGSWKIPYTIT